MKLPLVVLCSVLLGVVAGCSDEPSASSAQTPDTHVLSETTATIDAARDVGKTLDDAAALQRQATEQATQ